MEPITHFLTGACIARAGLNRKTAYATLAVTLAAEAPDLDVLWSLKGPVAAFQHHRGFTHTLLGSPVVAAATVALVYGLHRVWLGHRKRGPRSGLAPRWGLLFLFCWIGSLSHILLDFTNNYGVRPFEPFLWHWYAWDIVPIIDPLLLVVLFVGLVAPALFGLVQQEIGGQRPAFRGRGWAIFALIFMVLWWGFRDYQHRRALAMLNAHIYHEEEPEKIGAYPYPLNPFLWHGVVETRDMFVTLPVDTSKEFSGDPEPQSGQVFYKSAETAATLAAKRSWLGRVYLDWARFPLAQGVPASEGETEVIFSDLRFGYKGLFSDQSQSSRPRVLSGSVLVDRNNRVIEMKMGERVQPMD